MLRERLTPQGVEVHVEPPFEYGDSTVSSSLIRRQIRAGNMMLVKARSAIPYRLCGEVVHGAQNGRAMNFPTANIDFDEALMLPSLGVYARARLARQRAGAEIRRRAQHRHPANRRRLAKDHRRGPYARL